MQAGTWHHVVVLITHTTTHPIAIEPGSDTAAWGVVVPDLPGCFSAADEGIDQPIVKQAVPSCQQHGRRQPHVYQALVANRRKGYWPAGALVEGDASTGKWQPLSPVASNQCTVFPHGGALRQAQQGGYAWALWRPYSCCQQRDQTILGSDMSLTTTLQNQQNGDAIPLMQPSSGREPERLQV